MFRIYPKKGEPFLLDFAKFDFDEGCFTLYESPNRPLNHSFLSADHVAAVVPREMESGRFRDEIRFRIYLKNRIDPIEIIAHEFDPKRERSINFYWLPLRHNEVQRKKLENIYIAWSEVVAILPSEPET